MKILTVFLAAVLASLLSQSPAKKANVKSKFFSRSSFEVKNIFEGFTLGNKCKNVKQNNETPSANKGHSPIKSFGYPNFSINTKSTMLDTKVSLSFIKGFRQPIHLGVYDYLIAGTPRELKAFFDCFSDYEVIGHLLNEDGKWEKEKGTIKIQLSNLMKSPKFTESLWEMMFTIGLDTVTKLLDPSKIISNELFGKPTILKNIDQIKKAWRVAQKYLPIPENMVDKVAEICAKDLPIKEKINEFMVLLKNEQNQLSAFKEKWSGKDNVSTKSKILVSLTMYTKPEHRVRATYDTGKSKIYLKEIGDAVDKFLTKVS